MVLHLHVDGVRTVNHTTGTWTDEVVLVTTVLRHRSIGISSFFKVEYDEPFEAVYIAGMISKADSASLFTRIYDWSHLDLGERLQRCVQEHAVTFAEFLGDMGLKAEYEIDRTTLQRFQLAALHPGA